MLMKFERDTRGYILKIEQVGGIWEFTRAWGKAWNPNKKKIALFGTYEAARQELLKEAAYRTESRKYVRVEA